MIRDYSATDLEAVTEIYNHYVARSTATFDLRELTAAEMAARLPIEGVIVAEEAGQVAGYAYVHPWKQMAAYACTGEVTVYVHPDLLGHGVGRQLARELLLREAAAGRYSTLIACITAGNDASVALFESLGFRQVSCFRDVGQKFGKKLDVVDFQLNLN